MEAVYYRTKSGEVPARDFLDKYLGKNTTKNQAALVARINSVIELALEKGGIPGGDFSASIIGHRPLRELRIKGNRCLIRINYYCRGDHLVLLNVYIKKSAYPPRGIEARKVGRMIKEAWSYYEDFMASPNQYEKYEQ
jgi:hypothetical protein